MKIQILAILAKKKKITLILINNRSKDQIISVAKVLKRFLKLRAKREKIVILRRLEQRQIQMLFKELT